MTYLKNLAAVPALVRAAFRRVTLRLAAALRLVAALSTVAALRTMQRAAVTAWRWFRIGQSNVGRDSTRYRAEGLAVAVERKRCT